MTTGEVKVETGWNIDNSYARLPKSLYSILYPTVPDLLRHLRAFLSSGSTFEARESVVLRKIAHRIYRLPIDTDFVMKVSSCHTSGAPHVTDYLSPADGFSAGYGKS